MIEFSYQHLLHDVALRVNALEGTNKVAITSTYDTANLTAANFKSADWPFNSFRDAILMAVADFAWAIADTGGHPWRSVLGSVTVPLASGITLPSKGVDTHQIVGILGAVFDSADNTVLSEQPIDVVRRINKEGWRTYPLYYFKFDGDRIYHTRPFVQIECCTYSQDTQLATFTSNGDVFLPAVLRPALMARALALLTKDNAFAEQAAMYKAYSDEALMRIRGGLTTLPSKTLPSPTVSQT